MKAVLLDKIGSVTRNCRLPREVRLATEIECVEGSVVAVRVRSTKSTYNQLELPSGRFSQLRPGDVVAGTLGHRKALFGYSGHLPEALRPGDPINLLNLGGVLGICDSANPDLGPPFECETLGQVLHFPYLAQRIGVPAHIRQGAIPLEERLEVGAVPVVAIVGTCMNAGKTAAACALIQALTHLGYQVAAGKATGVSLRRDIHAMEDAGARQTMIFTDLGIVTTTPQDAPRAARTLLTQLAADRPDVIVLELGDGLLGLYGVDAILNDVPLRTSFGAVVMAANDPVAAWGGAQLLRERHQLEPTVVTGPATDNTAGTRLIAAETGVTGHNARTDAAGLAARVLTQLGLGAAGAPIGDARWTRG
ncbi:MAG: hypothetical protein IT349_21785 [Candidatus Eisenbacteria bacterium]|nr:hypothetical protein [Candidatus Eisenbacteria bacterium]MCC7144742.1 hypothetical protein [Candidatus Eisenbacteria bacterium]